MTLYEFAALKPGDKIANHMAGSAGEIVSRDDKGVHVRWGKTDTGIVRHYSVQSTIWMHWSVSPSRECTAGRCYREDCIRHDQCLSGDYDKIAQGA